MILLGVLLAVLVFFNLKFEWYLQIDAPNWVRFTWPGLVALLIYAAFRLVFYIIAQIPSAQTQFPDIEESVEMGLGAIQDANLSIRDIPLFLVVGLSPQEERSFLESSLVGKDIRVADHDLPIHWYRDNRAIWVTLPGVSAIVAQAKLSAAAGGEPPPRRQAPLQINQTLDQRSAEPSPLASRRSGVPIPFRPVETIREKHRHWSRDIMLQCADSMPTNGIDTMPA